MTDLIEPGARLPALPSQSDIEALRARAEAAAAAAEEASRKANNEALFASNAKQHCEEHATGRPCFNEALA